MISFKNFLAEMARPKKMIDPDTSTGVLDAAGLVNTIGKTRANAVFNHPWHKKHVAASHPHKVGYKVTTDKYGYPTVRASSTFSFDYNGKKIRKMVEFPMSKITNKVYNAHVFNNYDDERHRPEHGGGPVWHYRESYKKDDGE